jgi:hypothetical protein
LLTVPQFAVKLVTVTLVAALATGAEGVGDGVGVAVGVGVGVGVGSRLCAAERLLSTIRPHAAAAKHAIAMSRLIPRKKGLAVMLEELASSIFYGNGETKFRKFWIFFDSRRFKNCQPFRNGLISMIVIAIRLVFFRNQHKRSFEHGRARKRPTDTSEANSALQNCPRCFGSD